MIIVIDDERTFDIDPAANVWYARTSSEGISCIVKAWMDCALRYGEDIEAIYLDHDLGGDDDIRVVVDFLHFMAYNGQGILDVIDNVYVHSQNPTTDWIEGMLNMAGFNAKRIPLPELV